MAKLSILQIRSHGQRLALLQSGVPSERQDQADVVVVGGVEEKHTEGRYFLNSNNRWIDVGTDAIDAQRKRLLLLNQMEYARLSGRSLAPASAGQPTVVEFSGRKVIKDEVKSYLADLELTRRPARTCSPSASTSAISSDSSEKSSRTNTAARMFSSTRTNCTTKPSSRRPSIRG